MLPLFVIDPAVYDHAGAPRRAYLTRSLRALNDSLDGHLVVRRGQPVHELRAIMEESGAGAVHCAADFSPYGHRRDEAVAAAVPLVRTGSPYAVAPGRVTKPDGSPYAVFSAFFRAWANHGWRQPIGVPVGHAWHTLPGVPIPDEPQCDELRLPRAGERAALDRWTTFRDGRLPAYSDDRDRIDIAGSSQLSAALKFGEIHPRTLLADLGTGAGAAAFRTELCWREFFADVLYRVPQSAWESLRPSAEVPTDAGSAADASFTAWATGRTGFPIIDAAMRQLLHDAWMPNRMRMVVASFLIKDLHLPWWSGARHFLDHLVDGDVASNSHNWQWVAGTGLDAAPYHRIFNPILQAKKCDPDGDYVRRHVPELRDVHGPAVHEPWTLRTPPAHYPERIVDHPTERAEAIRRAQR